MEKIITPDNFNCPECNVEFTEEDLMELCGEPFNGTILICKNCKKEFDANLLIKIVEIK